MFFEYYILILIINKWFENGNLFDVNICIVIYIVEGYVILVEIIGLIFFYGFELSYSILFWKKMKKKIIFCLMEVCLGVEIGFIILFDFYWCLEWFC